MLEFANCFLSVVKNPYRHLTKTTKWVFTTLPDYPKNSIRNIYENLSGIFIISVYYMLGISFFTT